MAHIIIVILFIPWSVGQSKSQWPPFDRAPIFASEIQPGRGQCDSKSTNFHWIPVLPVAWFCPNLQLFLEIFFWKNLKIIWAIDGYFVFFAIWVFDLELVVLESINQNSVRFFIKKIAQSCYYSVTTIKGVLK